MPLVKELRNNTFVTREAINFNKTEVYITDTKFAILFVVPIKKYVRLSTFENSIKIASISEEQESQSTV